MCVIVIITTIITTDSLSNLTGKEYRKGTVSALLTFFIVGFCVLLNFFLIDANDRLIKESKGKCPEYQEIKAYTLKNK